MAVTVDEVIVSLEAKLDRYTANLSRAERDFRNATQNMERHSAGASGLITHHFDEMGRHVARSIALLAGVEGFRRLGEGVLRAVENADKLRSLAKLIGITTDELQALQQQAQEFGSSSEEVSQGLAFFTRQLGLAASGSGNLLKILQANKVALRDSKGEMRPFMELLGAYADLIKNAADQQARLVLTAEGFGRGSAELANTFAGGSTSITQFSDKVESTGRVIKRDVIDQLAEMKPVIDAIGNKWTVAWNSAIIGSDSFFEKVFRKSATLQEYLERLPGTGKAIVEPIDRRLTPDQMINQSFRGISEFGNDPALEAALRRRGSIAAGGAKGLGSDFHPGKDELSQGDGSTIIPDFSPGPDTAKKWDEATKAIEADTAVLVEQAKQVSNTRFEQEKAVATQQLVNEAIRAGVEITPQLTAQIDKLAIAHANAVVNLENLEEAQGRLTDRIDAFKDGSKEVLRGFIDDLRQGTSASEALYNALQNIESKLLDVALNSVFDALFGTSGKGPADRGGLLGSILGSLFGGGTTALAGGGIGHAAKGGILTRPTIAGEAGAEAAVPLPDGRRIPVDLRMDRIGDQRRAAPNVNISFEPEIVPPQGMETNIESVSDGRGGQKPRVFFTQVVQQGLASPASRTAAGLPARVFRRGG